MNKHAIKLGEQVAFYRRRQGISQENLALTMGSTQSTISRLENGIGETTLDKVIEAAEALGMRVTVTLRKK